MSELIHCIYASSATHPMSQADLEALLQQAKQNNGARGVTGILIYMNGTFFQVLEGERTVVEDLYDHIRRDPRHTNVTPIVSEAIARRTFNDMSMSFSFLSEEDLRKILDHTGEHGREFSVAKMRDGRAKKLLHAFSEGRWRMQAKMHVAEASA